MCQLTIANVRNARRNAAITTIAAIIDADHNAPHGFGFWNGKTVWKTETKADEISNLGDIVASLVTEDNPIISHVRFASKGIDLKEENNHPFETKDFIGAHNGTLYLTDEEPIYTYPENSARGSDSKRFFEMLQEEYEKNGGNFIAAITTVMGKHKGKFAFLIYEKPKDAYYIVKGKTADLYFADVFQARKGQKAKYIGFIVNTDEYDLKKITHILPNLWGLMGEGEGFEFSKPIELEDEKIYKIVGLKIKDIGELKENPLFTPTTSIQHRQNFGNSEEYWQTAWQKATNRHQQNSLPLAEGKSVNIEKLVTVITEWQTRHFLTPHDMDLIFYKTLGTPVADASAEDLVYFVKEVMTKLSRNKNTRKLFKAAGIKIVPSTFYSNYKLKFPWMVNDQETLMVTINKYQKENQRSLIQ